MKPFQTQTYYELLEISVSASTAEIRSAYERLSRLYTDDQVALYGLVEPSQAAALRARLLEAMEILTDDELREVYDSELGLPPRATHAPTIVPGPANALATAESTQPPPQEQGSVALVAAAANDATAAANDVPDDDDELDEPGQLAMKDLLEVADSTAPRVSFEYVPAPQPALSPPTQLTALAPAAAVSPRPTPPPPALQASAEASEVTSVRQEEPAATPVPVVAESPPQPAPSPPRALAVKESRAAEVPRPKTIEIAPDAEFNGELLRTVRQSLGVSVQQLAEKTRIGSRHLENIEADRYDSLPAMVYLRGMLMNIARELKLDGLRVSKSYIGLVERQRPKG